MSMKNNSVKLLQIKIFVVTLRYGEFRRHNKTH